MRSDHIDRVCVVTGAGSGLGRAMAIGLAQAGARVVAADLNLAGAEATSTQDESCASLIAPRQVDLTRPRECDDLINWASVELGRVDVLVNCAGLNMAIFRRDFLTRLVRFWEVDPEKWQRLYDLNVRAPFLLARAVAPGMVQRGWGRIVNITTSFSTMMREGNTPYGQAKAALEAATAGWAEDLSQTGVTCNALIPGGAADTPMIPSDAPVDRSRLVKPSAMTLPIRYLASDASDGVTGMRFIASKWDSNADDQTNVRVAASPAAWPDLADRSGAPRQGSVATSKRS